MPRTTAELVAGIVETLDEDDVPQANLDPYILSANELVTEMCVPAGYSDTRLELIERWLAAHFYAVFDPRSQNESAGVSAGFEGSAAMHLDRTRYGQQALILDTSGALAQLNKQAADGKRRGSQFFWAGALPAQQRQVQDEDAEDA